MVGGIKVADDALDVVVVVLGGVVVLFVFIEDVVGREVLGETVTGFEVVDKQGQWHSEVVDAKGGRVVEVFCVEVVVLFPPCDVGSVPADLDVVGWLPLHFVRSFWPSLMDANIPSASCFAIAFSDSGTCSKMALINFSDPFTNSATTPLSASHAPAF